MISNGQRWTVIMLGAAIALAACGDSGHDNQGELPGARFATVGRMEATFVDASRPTQPNGTYPGAPTRTLASIVWYPGVHDTHILGEEITCTGGLAGNHRGVDRCEVAPSVSLDDVDAPYPLIVMSHGFGNGASATTYFSQALAQHGYVVVAPDFPLSNRNAPGGASVGDLPGQAGDVKFLVDVFLGEVAGGLPTLAGKIDAAHVGAAGRSLGASTTLLATHNVKYRDPRIAASAPISPAWEVQTALLGRDGYFTGISTPLLIVGGSDDDTTPFAANQQAPYDLAGPPKILVEQFGQGHVPETEDTNVALIAFFDEYLRGRRAELAAIDRLIGAQVEKQL